MRRFPFNLRDYQFNEISHVRNRWQLTHDNLISTSSRLAQISHGYLRQFQNVLGSLKDILGRVNLVIFFLTWTINRRQNAAEGDMIEGLVSENDQPTYLIILPFIM